MRLNKGENSDKQTIQYKKKQCVERERIYWIYECYLWESHLCNKSINHTQPVLSCSNVSCQRVQDRSRCIFCLPNALSMRSRYLSMFRDVQLREVKPGCIASSTCQVSHVWYDDGDALCKQPAVTVSLIPVTSLMLRKDSWRNQATIKKDLTFFVCSSDLLETTENKNIKSNQIKWVTRDMLFLNVLFWTFM